MTENVDMSGFPEDKRNTTSPCRNRRDMTEESKEEPIPSGFITLTSTSNRTGAKWFVRASSIVTVCGTGRVSESGPNSYVQLANDPTFLEVNETLEEVLAKIREADEYEEVD